MCSNDSTYVPIEDIETVDKVMQNKPEEIETNSMHGISAEEMKQFQLSLEKLQPIIQNPLSPVEVTAIHELLSRYKPKDSQPDKSDMLPPFPADADKKDTLTAIAPEKTVEHSKPAAIEHSEKKSLAQDIVYHYGKLFHDKLTASDVERQAKNEIVSLIENYDEHSIIQAIISLSAVFPLQNSIRNGTSDEKRFAMITSSDRFLTAMSGLKSDLRKPLVKRIGKYLTDISDKYGFISHEGSQFDNQTYERVEGSSSSGKIIREIHSYLVINKESKMVFRLGRALL